MNHRVITSAIARASVIVFFLLTWSLSAFAQTTVQTAGTHNPGGTWADYPFTAQTGTVDITFTYQSSHADPNVRFALSETVIDAARDQEIAVQVDNGIITARNGSSFSADSVISYTPNAVYTFRLRANISSLTYDAYVTEDSGSEQLIGANFSFRDSPTELDHFAMHGWGGFTLSDVSITLPGSGSDTEAPSIPTGLATTSVTDTTVDLSWQASTDNVSVTGYEIFRDGTSQGTSQTTSFSDSGLSPATAYSYTVTAFDAAENDSNPSSSLSVTTNSSSGGGATIASAGTYDLGGSYVNIPFTAQTGSVTATVNYQSSDANPNHHIVFADQAVNSTTDMNIRIRIKDGLITATDNASLTSENVVTFTQNADHAFEYVFDIPNNTYNLTVKVDGGPPQVIAQDYAFKYSVTSLDHFVLRGWRPFDLSDVTLNGGGGGGDNQPPTAPTNLTASGITETAATISWTAATDNVGIDNYKVHRDGQEIGTVTTTSFADSGLTSGTAYSYHVVAYDAAANWSPDSTALIVTTNSAGGNSEIIASAGTYDLAGAYVNFPFTSQSGDLEATFNYQSPDSNPNHHIVFADQAVNSTTDMNIRIRIKDGLVTASDNASLTSETVIAFIQNADYEFRYDFDIANNTYDLFVKVDGGPQQTIAQDYAFKHSVTSLNHLTLRGWRDFDLSDTTLSWGGGSSGPSTPTGLTGPATDEDGVYTISWSASTSSTTYQLERRLGTGNWSQVYSGAPTSFDEPGLADGTYEYRVRGCDAQSVCSDWSTTHTTIVQPASSAPPTPTGLTGPTSDDDGSYTISWNASAGATSYELEQRLGTGSWSQVYSAAGTSDPQTVTVEGSYAYRVRACASSCSSWSSLHTVDVDFAPQTPPPPTPPAPLPFNDPGQATAAETDTIGTTAGNFRVNESGAATYSIPIATAAGTAGVAPQISLNYSSSAGNGLVGHGWSIGGLSSITRCRQTYDQDRNVTAITFTSADRFCLDGQRLVRTSLQDTYGDAGTQYRTEIDSGVIVTIESVANGEPSEFSVWRKDGSLSHYGQAPGSGDQSAKLQDATGRTLTWSIRRFTDSVGNPIWFDYTSTAGAQRISEIRWAYGASPGPNSGSNARLVFTYESRDDDISGYVAGSAFETDQRLLRIDSQNTAGGVVNGTIRTYHLNYNEGISANDELSRLTSIQECVGSTCLQNKTTFSWTSPTPNVQPIAVSTFAMGSSVVTFRPTDINGDGQMDLVILRGNNSTKTLEYALSDGDGYTLTAFSSGGTQKSVQVGSNNPQIRTFDFNMDGRQDVAYWHTGLGEWRVVLAEPHGNGLWRLNSTDVPTGLTEPSLTFIDADSNGTADAVYSKFEVTTSYLYVRRLLPNPAMASTPQSPTFYYFAPEDSIVGSGGVSTLGEIAAVAPDFNGDGRVDLLMGGMGEMCDENDPDDCTNINNSGYLFTLTGVENNNAALTTYFQLPSVNIGGTSHYPTIDQIQVVDLNMDGLSDLFYPLSTLANDDAVRFEFRLNQGNGTFSPAVSLPATDTEMLDEDADVQVVDWNTDGYPDVLWRNPSVGAIYARYWNPQTGNFDTVRRTISSVVSGNGVETAQFFDMNGDAATDMLRVNKNGNVGSTDVLIRRTGSNNLHAAANRIDEIVNGFGAKTEIDYEPLSTSSNYTRLQVASSVGTGTFCEDHGPNDPICYDEPVEVANLGAFYTTLNSDDWGYPSSWQTLGKTSPVLEFSGPMYVVTQVTDDAPAAGLTPENVNLNATSSIAYHYGEAKVQAAGRGFLGFQTLTTIDEQSQISTTTRYRQDWPFIGMPIGTYTESSNGTLLSSSSTEWNVEEWQSAFPDTAENDGTAKLQAVHVLTSRSTDNEYDLVNDGLVAGGLVRSVVTDFVDYNEEGYALDMLVTTMNGSGTTVQTVRTQSTYFDNGFFDPFEGRLETTTVTTDRPAFTEAPPSIRYSTFTYYTNGDHKGLLRLETIEPNRSEFTLETEHSYDGFGNLVQSAVTGDGVTRCAVPTATYDTTSGRYVDETRDCLGRLTSTVEARNVYGSPTQTRVYVDTNGSDYVEQRMSYSVLGREYYRYSSTGASSTQYLTTVPGINCPVGTTTKSLSLASTGAQTQTCMDKLGREVRALTRAFNGAWYAQDTEYDDRGRVRFKSDPYTFSITSPIPWTTQSYDLLNRPTATELPDTSTSTTAYMGLTTTVTNDLQQTRTEVRNALGEVISVTDHASSQTLFGYDHVGNMVSMDPQVGGQAAITVMTYDDLGRKETMDDPDKGYWTYEYNHFGELVKQTDAEGQVQEMGYDGMGRMVSRIDRLVNNGAAQAHAVWNYDSAPYGLGQIADVQDLESGYLKVYSYDSLGRQNGVTTTIGTDTYFESSTYDEHGRPYQAFDAAGADHGVAYAYNAHGYLNRVADAIEVGNVPREIYQEILAMNARGQVTVQYLGDDEISTTFDYFEDTGRLRRIDSVDLGVGTKLQDLNYTWDTIGNLDSRDDASGSSTLTENFTYDNLNRLETYSVTGQAMITVTYDSLGNVISKTDVEGGATYSYNGSGGPHAVSSIGSISYTYDDNGNMKTGDGRVIDYTIFHKPSSISRGGHTTSFEYGPDRSRYEREDVGVSGTTTTRYVGNVEIITRPNGSQERKRYIGDFAIRTVYFGFNSIEDSAETHYRLSDHLGSIGVITNATGGQPERFAYDPWGQRRDATDWSALSASALSSFDTTRTTRGFTGHETLDAVGIIHMNGRIYDPKIARFVQADPFIQDPMNTQSLNRYSYVLNNPLNATDPSGYFAQFLAAGLLLGAAGREFDVPLLAEIGSILACQTVACAGWMSFGSTLGAGGSFQDAFRSGVLSSLSAGAFGEIGASFQNSAFEGGRWHALAHATAGGVLAEMQGGKFGHGFLSAGVTKFYNVNDRFGRDPADRNIRVVSAGVIGGTVSALSGGKFANGAVTAAFAQLYNGEEQTYFKEDGVSLRIHRGLPVRGNKLPGINRLVLDLSGEFYIYTTEAMATEMMLARSIGTTPDKLVADNVCVTKCLLGAEVKGQVEEKVYEGVGRVAEDAGDDYLKNGTTNGQRNGGEMLRGAGRVLQRGAKMLGVLGKIALPLEVNACIDSCPKYPERDSE